MKKLIIGALGILFAVALVFSVFQNTQKAQGQSALVRGVDLAARTSSATTTPNYMTTGTGTTTLGGFSVGQFEEVSIAYRLFASSTTGGNGIANQGVLYIEPQASHDGIDWYNLDLTEPSLSLQTATTSQALASTTGFYTHNSAITGATSTKKFVVKTLGARFARFIFSVSTSTAMPTAYRDGMNIYAEAWGTR